MKITVLGSGTSGGVPEINCSCKVCSSTNPKNKRLRSSCLIEIDGKNILIDSSPDLRQQALTNKISRVDAVLYTHVHADHIHGLDDLRVYNAYQQAAIPVFGTKETVEHLVKNFSYIFRPSSAYPSLIPRLESQEICGPFDCLGINVISIPCHHGPKYMTNNYRVGNAAWLTDTNGIPESSKQLLKNLDVLFLDGLRLKPHPTHFSLEEALKTAKEIAAKKTYLIHLTHDYDHDEFNKILASGKILPGNIELAYDGLQITI